MSLKDSLRKIEEEFQQFTIKAGSDVNAQAVEEARVHFLGKKGLLTLVMDLLRTLPKEEKPAAGKEINEIRQKIEHQLTEFKTRAESKELFERAAKEIDDVTLPVSSQVGSLHPITLVRRQLLGAFRSLGFKVVDGPEIDFESYNFTALNMPDDHPARDMQDTFYVESDRSMVLRTHTSNIQIHAMLAEKPPLRVVAPGRVFRCDSDATHTPMFHQIEGFVVDEGISMAHLKGTIDAFLFAVFARKMKTRFRPSFFPFTEPSAEFDMECGACSGKGCRTCKNTGWIEVGGCGMIHPNVLENCQIDSAVYSGFAFGFGMDRLAAVIKFGLPDIRQLFEGRQQFLKQFPIFG